MTFPGYLTVIRASGIPTTMAFDGMSTFSGSSTASLFVYQIDTTSRQVWDRKVVPTFIVASSLGSTISSTAIVNIDYLFGKVTVNSTLGAVIVVTGAFMPMAVVAGAHSYTLTQTADVLDDTDFTSTGFRSKNVGLHDVSLTLNSWEPLDNTFYEVLVASSTSVRRLEPLIGEVTPGGSTLVARGWFVVESNNLSGDVAALEEASISLQIDGDDRSAFRWSDQ